MTIMWRQILKHVKEFIIVPLEVKISKYFAQFIWYYTTWNRFYKVAKDFLDYLRNTYPDSKIAILLVYTQTINFETVSEIAYYINKEKIYSKFIPVLADNKKLTNSQNLEEYELDNLLNESLKRCEKALSGDMRDIMANQIYRNN